MALTIDHHMLRLQVTVNYEMFMEVLKCADHFCCIEGHVVPDL